MNAYLFDVDGVLNNNTTGFSNYKPEIIEMLISKLKKGEPVGLISGRSQNWQIGLVETLEKYIDQHEDLDKTIIDNLFVASEFGAAMLLHKNAVRKPQMNHEYSIDDDLKERLKIIALEFAEHLWIDDSKEHTFTVVTNQELSKEEFYKIRDIAAERFEKIIGDDKDIEIHKDRMAINVRNIKANKHEATNVFLDWLNEKNLTPQKYYVFGDSISDLEMGESLHEKSLDFDFIFVGDRHDLSERNVDFQVHTTESHSDQGTLEYFKSKQL